VGVDVDVGAGVGVTVGVAVGGNIPAWHALSRKTRAARINLRNMGHPLEAILLLEKRPEGF
jgi:hypothetical protein